MATPPALEISGLVKRYGAATAVDGLSLTAARGEVTALLGPNGAGKTSTVEICEGFRPYDSGTVRVLGLAPDDPALKPRIGVMPQTGGVPGTASAAEFLNLMAAFHAVPLPPAALMERLGLTEHAKTPYRRLSGGQQQRLCIA
ncbi:ATP-binding cassette domain-containing protein, partial [Actinocorallia lasiicapitis]